MAEKTARELLAELFRRGGLTRAVRRARVALVWPQVAGPKLSRFTRARSFRDGILYVDTTDSETAMHLSLQRERFLKAFRAKGHRELKDIRFVPGRVEAPAAEQPELPEEAAAEDVAALTGALSGLELPEAVAQAALAAGEGIARNRTRRRHLGWTPCAVCGTLSEQPGLCFTCERYSQEAATQRAASALRHEPTAEVAWLTADQKRVAVHLSSGQLAELMQTLLPQVIADGRLRPQLEQVARNWLLLRHGLSGEQLTDEHWEALPANVLRVLGRG